MTLDRFSSRLDPATYENEDGHVYVFELDPDEEDSLRISERLFFRLTAVATAYELHTLPMLGGSDPVLLNRPMCQSLLDEIAFVVDRLNDPIAASTAQTIQDYVAARIRRPDWDGPVTFEVTRQTVSDPRHSAATASPPKALQVDASTFQLRFGLSQFLAPHSRRLRVPPDAFLNRILGSLFREFQSLDYSAVRQTSEVLFPLVDQPTARHAGSLGDLAEVDTGMPTYARHSAADDALDSS